MATERDPEQNFPSKNSLCSFLERKFFQDDKPFLFAEFLQKTNNNTIFFDKHITKPTDPEKQKYMFTDDIKFLQKEVVFHNIL